MSCEEAFLTIQKIVKMYQGRYYVLEDIIKETKLKRSEVIDVIQLFSRGKLSIGEIMLHYGIDGKPKK